MPVTALLASEPGAPVVVFDSNAALRMAVVDRQSVSGLDDVWDAPGVYLLLDPATLEGEYGVYVGKAPAGMRQRVKQHLKGKAHWSRALLVTRDMTHGWHSAHVGWLEGRLYDLLDGASLATLSNGNRATGRDAAGVRAGGAGGGGRADRGGAATAGLLDGHRRRGHPRPVYGRTTKRQYNVDVVDLLQAGDLTAGEKLSSTRVSAPATAVVGVDGSITVDGKTFGSPSAAGSHVRGGKATNGWAFRAAERDGTTVPLATIGARYLRKKGV